MVERRVLLKRTAPYKREEVWLGGGADGIERCLSARGAEGEGKGSGRQLFPVLLVFGLASGVILLDGLLVPFQADIHDSPPPEATHANSMVRTISPQRSAFCLF